MGTLQEYRSELDRVAEALLDREEIPGDEVLKLIGVQQESSTEGSEDQDGTKEKERWYGYVG